MVLMGIIYHIFVPFINSKNYSYTSMYTKYNYIYMSTIELLCSYMSVYTNLPK